MQRVRDSAYLTGGRRGVDVSIAHQAGIDARRPAFSPPARQWLVSLSFLAAHAALAPLMRESSTIATLHAIVTLVVAMWAAVRWRPEQVMYVAAYITGAEILWRMTDADVYWEVGKYAVAVVFIVAALRLTHLSRWQLLPLLYFLLLLPSVVLVDPATGFGRVREEVSSNLSGPFALAASAFFACRTTLSRAHLRHLSVALAGPVIAIAVISLLATLGMSAADFTDESNFVAAGGFGPNQVSSILGLAALAAFLSIFDPEATGGFKAMMLGVMILTAVQSALTFSRGGLDTALGAAVLGSLYLLRDARTRTRLVGFALVLAVAVYSFLWPRLDAFTEGKISVRFRDLSPTGRDVLLRDDLRIWLEHPITGVGPGGVPAHRAVSEASAHTEFSRLLAEHGVLGLGAVVTLLVICGGSLRQARTAASRALVVSLFAWSFLHMSHSAMRTVAPAFVFGLACARFPRGLVRHAAVLPRLGHEVSPAS